MRKIIIIVLLSFLMVGCGNMNNTPTKQVEMFLEKYQVLDEDVLEDLNNITLEEEKFNTAQRERYISLMKKHYQNIKYEIKDEEIDGDNAIVKVEIEVIDYSKKKAETREYLKENPEFFNDENGEYDEVKYMDYMLDELEKSNEKVKYTINFTLTKKDDKWHMDDLNNMDEDKLHGVYEY